jgi:hypothetical protein
MALSSAGNVECAPSARIGPVMRRYQEDQPTITQTSKQQQISNNDWHRRENNRKIPITVVGKGG